MRVDFDPDRILLNRTGFRRKFHIYEIAQTFDRNVDGTVHVVRKQLVNHGSTLVMQELNKSEKHIELQVERENLAELYEMVRELTLPASRTGHAGKDGSCYGLQIGIRPCSTTIRWWSDMEPELQPVYKLRNMIVETVNRVIRSATTTNAN